MKMSCPVSCAILAFVAIVGPAPAAAQTAQQVSSAIDMLARADDDRDGAVTEAELRRFRREAFQRLDANQDLRLSGADLPRWTRVMGASGAREQFEQFRATLDADQNGAVSRAEFIGGPSFVFDALDVDRNRTVDAAEFAAVRAAVTARQP